MSTTATHPSTEALPRRPRIQQRLAMLRRRMMLLGTLGGICWGLVSGLVLWGAFVWLDLLWELSPPLRIVANGLVMIVACGIFLETVLYWRKRAVDRSLAKRLDQAGGTGGQILSGYDLERASFAHSPSPLTAGMAVMATNRAAQVAAGIPSAQAVPAKDLRPALLSAFGLLLAMGFLFVFLPRLVQTEWLRFSDPYSVHRSAR